MQLKYVQPNVAEVVGLLIDNQCAEWDIEGHPNICKVDLHCWRLLIEFEFVVKGYYKDEEDTIWIPSVVRIISVEIQPF